MPITAPLRLLLTSDLHMHLLGYDYTRAEPTDRVGLEGLAPLIARARSETAATLLFDNGDFLQGTPMADLIAEGDLPTKTHPMIDAFNDLRYDAIALGNHEFDYGLPFLQDALKDCTMPVVCANARTGPTTHITRPWSLLERKITCSDGSIDTLKIGVIGFVTPPLVDWNAHILAGQVQTDDILTAARSHLPALRRAGADLVIALCHAGISDAPLTPGMENPSLHLAGLPGIDVILTGHTHDHFPSSDFDGMPGVDVGASTLNGTPGLMPGAFGSTLGQLDLLLERDDDGWRLSQHRAHLHHLPVPVLADAHPAPFAQRLTDLQKATLDRLQAPVCTTPRRVTSFFAALGRDDTAQLAANAMLAAARKALADTELEALPLLAATTPHRSGGHQGPANFVDLQPGPVMMRDIVAIMPFNNPMALALRWGWQIRAWLETASRMFHQLEPCQTDQPLISGQIPAYHFDSLQGLRYRFDLTVPPRLNDDLSRPMRTRDITYQGLPVRDDDRFVVATSTYRAYGGGGYPTIPVQDIVHISRHGLADILIDHLRDNGVPAKRPTASWQIAPLPGASAWFATSPDALDHAPDDLALSLIDQDKDGFTRLRLDL